MTKPRHATIREQIGATQDYLARGWRSGLAARRDHRQKNGAFDEFEDFREERER
jgi:hypothetical protein